MSNLKRYTESYCCGKYDGMEEDSLAGEWVKFDDIKELLNTVHNRQRDEILHLIMDDSFAISFQSFSQYRSALVKEIAKLSAI
jgi:hypothetical protein